MTETKRNIELNLTADELRVLTALLYEAGASIEDDGNEGALNAKLLYRLAKAIKESK